MGRMGEVVGGRAGVRARGCVGGALRGLGECPARTVLPSGGDRIGHNKVVNFEGVAAPGELVDVEVTAATSQTLSGLQSLVSPTAR